MTIVELLDKFQTGLVGVIGFTGVILTLVVNAWLDRRRLSEARDHDRNTLARALLAELHSTRQTLKGNTQGWDDDLMRYPQVLIRSGNATPVFDSNLARIGLLSDKQIDPVLRAYVCLKEFDSKLELISAPWGESKGESNHLYRSFNAPTFGKGLVNMVDRLLSELDAAIAALQGSVR